MLRQTGLLIASLILSLSAGAANRIGDANNDGTSTMQDARLVQRALLGLDPPTALSPLGVMNPDYNLDLRDLFDSARHAASGVPNRNGHAPGMISVGGMGDFSAYNNTEALGVEIQWSVQSNLALMAEMAQGLEATIAITTPGVGSSLGGVDTEVRADGTIRATFYPNETALTLVNVRLTLQVRDSDGSSVIEQHVDNLTIEVGPVSPAEFKCQQARIAYEQVKQNLATQVVRCRQDFQAIGVCSACTIAAENAAALISGNHSETTSTYTQLLWEDMPLLGNRAAPYNQTLPGVTSLGEGNISPFACPTWDGSVGVAVASGYNDNVPGHCNVAVCRDLSFDPACGEIGPVVEYVHDPYWDDPTPLCDQTRANYETVKASLQAQLANCRASAVTNGICTSCDIAVQNSGALMSGFHPGATCYYSLLLGESPVIGSLASPFDPTYPAADCIGGITTTPATCPTSGYGSIGIDIRGWVPADYNPGTCFAQICRDLTFEPACGEPFPVAESIVDPVLANPAPFCQTVVDRYGDVRQELLDEMEAAQVSNTFNFTSYTCEEVLTNVLFKHEGDHSNYPGNPCTPIQPFSCPANPGEEYNDWTLNDMAVDLGDTAMLGNVVIECADPMATSNMVVNIQRDLSNELGCGEPGAVGESLVRFYCGNLITETPLESCDDGNFDDCGLCNADCTGPSPADFCGDLIVCGAEACDDGPGGACFDDCSAVNVCGDGIAFNGEACDDGPGGACFDDCSAVNVCGDGTVFDGEVCDDGNTVSCDGCKDDCTRLDQVCGDSIIECAEFCDDGNATECGLCNYNCTNTSPADYCGDFQICDGEACDDGPANGSTPCGCQATCQYTAAGTDCRAASDLCDQVETCPGGGMPCPSNEFIPGPVPNEFTICSDQPGAQGGNCTSATCSADSISVSGNVGADCADSSAGTLTMTHEFNTQSPDGSIFNVWMRIVRDVDRDGGSEDYQCYLTGYSGGGILFFSLTESETGSGANGPGCVGVNGGWCWALVNVYSPIYLDNGLHALVCDSTSNSSNETGGHDGVIVTTDLAYIPAESANACDNDAAFTAGTCNTPPLNWGPNAYYVTQSTCRAATGDCDLTEACDGMSASCPGDAFVTAGTACDNGVSEPDADYCNGAGTCINPTCRDGVLDAGEACDDFPHDPGIVHSDTLPGMPPKDAVIYGSRGYLATGDGRLVVVDMNPPLYSVIGQYDTPGSSFGVTVVGNRAYVSNGTAGLVILDVTNPTPMLVTSYDTAGFAYDAFVYFNRAYVADGAGGLVVLDIMTTPPTFVTSTAVGGTAWDLVVEGNLAYVASDTAGLTVWDVTALPPALVGQAGTVGIATGVSLAGTLAYVGAWDIGGLRVYDISACPGGSCTPTLVGSYDSPGNAHHAFLRGARAYLSDWHAGVQVLDITSPQPVWVGGIDTPGNAYAVPVANTVALVADDTGGFSVLDVSEDGLCGFYCTGAASCGDGVIQSPETCDYGAGLNGSCGFCNADCLGFNVCGNDVVDPACGETCDDGVNNGGSAPGVCNGGCSGHLP